MKIGIGAITRRRPEMFAELLDSFANMKRPENAELIFLVAENDDQLSIEPQINAFRDKVSEPVMYDLEKRPGIPMARNNVLDMALSEGCDFLTFVDDDELVTEDWLVAIMTAMQDRNLDLAGGPLKLIAAEDNLSKMSAAILEHLQRRAQRRNRIRAAGVDAGTDNKFNIYTNNWCARLKTVRDLQVRFDEALQFTGGSDTKFSKDFSVKGAITGWVPNAYAVDRIPARRLKLSYHFQRARDQENNVHVFNQRTALRTISQSILGVIEALVFILLFPIMGRLALVKSVFKFGLVAGRVGATLGKRSSHYDKRSAAFHSSEDQAKTNTSASDK